MAGPDLSWAEDRPVHSAAVIYDTQFDETRIIAEALARGIRTQNVTTDLFPVEEAEKAALEGYALLVLGSPTELFTCSHRMRLFLSHLKTRNLKGRYGFAFATKIRHHPGRAAEHIHDSLEHLGFRMRMPPLSGFVRLAETAPAAAGPAHEQPAHVLEVGMERAFEEAGVDLIQRIRGESREIWEVPITATPPPEPPVHPEDPKRPKAKWPY